MALIIAEAVRRRLRDLADRVQAHKLALAATATSTIGVAILIGLGYGAFLLAASCMLVAGVFGGLAGFDLGRSRSRAQGRVAEHDLALLAAELTVTSATNQQLRQQVADLRLKVRLADERAASHLDEVKRLRGEVSGG
ncbi:hypothetical protein [Nonomuraea guangzhouensis]|uniref:Phage holin family protein n=1 Tax=Nonomuraea guangzhouensis TaxID=1291555 RepID=A0ABW4GWQ9_9ACTN|nr:hypothetical protein [Nonomuraea guangzhouensis]